MCRETALKLLDHRPTRGVVLLQPIRASAMTSLPSSWNCRITSARTRSRDGEDAEEISTGLRLKLGDEAVG